MDFDKILHIATFAGRIILESVEKLTELRKLFVESVQLTVLDMLKVLLPQLELWFLFTMRIIIQLL